MNKKNKIIGFIIAGVIVIVLGIGIFFLIRHINYQKQLDKMIIDLEENATFKVKEEINLESLVKKSEGGKLEIFANVDNTKIGEYKIIYRLTNENNVTKEKEIKIKIIDDEKPVINVKNNKVAVSLNGSVDLKKDVTATDNYDGDITSQIEVSGEVDTKKTGSYQVKYNVTDSSGNKADEKTCTFEVQQIYKLKYKKYVCTYKNQVAYLIFSKDKVEFWDCVKNGGCAIYKGKYTVNGNKISAHYTVVYPDTSDPEKVDTKDTYTLTKDGIKYDGTKYVFK